jgi:hypothetical protein
VQVFAKLLLEIRIEKFTYYRTPVMMHSSLAAIAELRLPHATIDGLVGQAFSQLSRILPVCLNRRPDMTQQTAQGSTSATASVAPSFTVEFSSQATQRSAGDAATAGATSVPAQSLYRANPDESDSLPFSWDSAFSGHSDPFPDSTLLDLSSKVFTENDSWACLPMII